MITRRSYYIRIEYCHITLFCSGSATLLYSGRNRSASAGQSDGQDEQAQPGPDTVAEEGRGQGKERGKVGNSVLT